MESGAPDMNTFIILREEGGKGVFSADSQLTSILSMVRCTYLTDRVHGEKS